MPMPSPSASSHSLGSFGKASNALAIPSPSVSFGSTAGVEEPPPPPPPLLVGVTVVVVAVVEVVVPLICRVSSDMFVVVRFTVATLVAAETVVAVSGIHELPLYVEIFKSFSFSPFSSEVR